jgi:SAM-dependent methyltransferase
MHSLIDFGYSGPWTHGHLVVTAVALPLALLAWRRRWPRALTAVLAALALWSVAAFLVVQFVFRFNDVPALPTGAFLVSGPARVVDLGAGSGRSTIMLLRARPQATAVALDNFSASYISGHGPEKTRANFRAAGVEARATVQTGDMRALPFPDASFDAALSVAAIDHLGGDDARKALGEAARVLKPKGQFLLEVMNPDWWMRFAWGPFLLHGASPDRMRARWTGLLDQAGFQVTEVGTQPITLYLLAVKR